MQIVSWKEALRRQSVDTEPSIMPELNDESSILNAKQIYEVGVWDIYQLVHKHIHKKIRIQLVNNKA